MVIVGIEEGVTGYTLYVKSKDNTELFSLPLISHLTTIYGVDFITLERFFEEKINFLTKGTVLEYNHRKPVMSECYLQECVSCTDSCEFYVKNKLNALLNSDIGMPSIYDHFCKITEISKNKKNGVNLKPMNFFNQ